MSLIHGICAYTKKIQVLSASRHWWEKSGIDLEVSLATAAESEDKGVSKSGEAIWWDI